MKLTPGKMTIPKGTILAEEGQALEAVIIVLSGKIMLYKDSFRMQKEQATCIGLNDIEKGVHSSKSVALEDSVIYVLPIVETDSAHEKIEKPDLSCEKMEKPDPSYEEMEKTDPIHAMIEKKDDFRAIFISSQYKSIAELFGIYERMSELAEKVYYLAPLSYRTYENRCMEAKIDPVVINNLEQMKVYEPKHEFDKQQIRFCLKASEIPLDSHRSYYAKSEEMARCQIEILGKMVNGLIEEIGDLAHFLDDFVDILLFQNQNLYECSLTLGKELRRQDMSMDAWKKYMVSSMEKLGRLFHALRKISGKEISFDLDEMECMIEKICQGEIEQEEALEDNEAFMDVEQQVLLLQNSLQQIIDYSEHDKKDLAAFAKGMEYFVAATDKMAYDDEMKEHKRNITAKFFALYKDCFFKSITKGNAPIAVKLFLHYGYMDENLLSMEQLMFLCKDQAKKEVESETSKEDVIKVYTMYEWLKEIYSGNQEPSKNEFDEDFLEYIKRLRSEGDAKALDPEAVNDKGWRVEFEVDNMFRVNDKICYGHISSYVPVLFQDVMYGHMEKMILSRDQMKDSIMKIEEIDYSAFYREYLCSFSDIAVYHFPMPVKAYPKVILIPGYGVNGSMWQEISGKDKTSSGRFLLPAILGTDLDEVMLKLVGRLRWELCRCVMGREWNDIRSKSFTAEYIGYMQFYRENKDLSEEARDKIKRQIVKARNNTREFFVYDYEDYIKKEYYGIMKLNKVARELLSTYVPFKKEIREKLKKQRPFEVAIARYERNRLKKEQELHSLIRNFQHKNKPVPEEVMEVIHYYEL